MSYGYSQRLIEANKKADKKSLGVALGRVCISRGIPVTEIADKLGVTRATVYNWFWGITNPTQAKVADISKMMQSLKNRK